MAHRPIDFIECLLAQAIFYWISEENASNEFVLSELDKDKEEAMVYLHFCINVDSLIVGGYFQGNKLPSGKVLTTTVNKFKLKRFTMKNIELDGRAVQILQLKNKNVL